MLTALKELHPNIASSLKNEIEKAATNKEKAKILFCGMFERGDSKANVQKGRYGQVLAQAIEYGGDEFTVPSYIACALKHVCEYDKGE